MTWILVLMLFAGHVTGGVAMQTVAIYDNAKACSKAGDEALENFKGRSGAAIGYVCVEGYKL